MSEWVSEWINESVGNNKIVMAMPSVGADISHFSSVAVVAVSITTLDIISLCQWIFVLFFNVSSYKTVKHKHIAEFYQLAISNAQFLT